MNRFFLLMENGAIIARYYTNFEEVPTEIDGVRVTSASTTKALVEELRDRRYMMRYPECP